MIFVIDAFNLIYKFPDLEELMYNKELEKAMHGLVEIIFEFKTVWKKPIEIHLFFDGKKKVGDETEREVRGGINIYYSKDHSADYFIKQFVKYAASPGEIRVISSDKDILGHCKKYKAHVQTSDEFAAWIKNVITTANAGTPKPEKDENPKLSDEEVNYWRKMFSERNKLV